ncbi:MULTISPECIES: metal-dependent hydrolase [Alicyclobacillus]|uniref:Metal-dependent hydrolase n=1 Tax=Alicyclobacillus acidoterrestris (strain ATCC 49025 / DSM 3922 / CIP 106132 / NCIMB 13137 / GD3B) TaxID=1356854 RepID=T0D3D8_ALIAG|nr:MULTISPECIES: metal-dependent hydrolase [Alicyclobacillus]EPZ44291.1 hypothetical protein N007_11185 [Alicyclobacillus acidoterrestris ATCC 49025]UNO51072.1 metal-dependent hydrolase [Alicyclobacillus acidoterrestris]GEO27701.1 hypothetical protein AAC03nite_34860 [Alicyclobacillus acidoterrestris]
MLGRTHMAVGALGAATAAPLLLHEPSHMLTPLRSVIGGTHSIESLVAVILAGAVGGLLPDMDQKDAQASRRVERIGQLASIIIIFGALFVLHLWHSPIAWAVAVLAYFGAISHAEWMRKLSMLLLAGGSFVFGVTHQRWMTSMIFAAVWFVAATFTPHRTFTHSIIGTAVTFGALVFINNQLHAPFLLDAIMIGYVLHILADAIAGGVPLLWPYKRRQGVRLVRTGDWRDHIIGSLSTILMLVVTFVR